MNKYKSEKGILKYAGGYDYLVYYIGIHTKLPAPALAFVAELLGGRDPDEVLVLARKCFLCVSADKIRFEDIAESTPNAALRVYTHKACLWAGFGPRGIMIGKILSSTCYILIVWGRMAVSLLKRMYPIKLLVIYY